MKRLMLDNQITMSRRHTFLLVQIFSVENIFGGPTFVDYIFKKVQFSENLHVFKNVSFSQCLRRCPNCQHDRFTLHITHQKHFDLEIYQKSDSILGLGI